MRESWIKYLQTPRRKYQEHKSHAKRRGIVFTLSYKEWWEIWNSSGKWKKRGNRKGQYCMSRLGDRGGYTPGNVFISKNEQNLIGAACKTNGRPHPDDLARANGKLFRGEPGPDVPF